jgi:hypothetical protein
MERIGLISGDSRKFGKPVETSGTLFIERIPIGQGSSVSSGTKPKEVPRKVTGHKSNLKLPPAADAVRLAALVRNRALPANFEIVPDMDIIPGKGAVTHEG